MDCSICLSSFMSLASLNSPIGSRRGIDCFDFLMRGTHHAFKVKVSLLHSPSSAFHTGVIVTRTRTRFLDLFLLDAQRRCKEML